MMNLEVEPEFGSGTQVEVSLDLPSGRAIELTGRVVWVSEVLPGIIGIAFRGDVPAPIVEALRALGEQRPS